MLDLNGARPHIEAALSYSGGTHTFDDVVKGVSTGKFVFWPGVNSAIITEIIEYPRQRTLHFFLAGGNMAELEVMLPGILNWGREQGCTTASLTGREGWARSFLKREGWNKKLIVMTKEL